MLVSGPGFYDNDFYVIKDGYSNLKEKLKRILMTIPGERVNNPLFGSRLKSFLFDFDINFYDRFRTVIKEDLEKWEPTITVNSITIDSIQNKVAKVKINFTVNSTGENIDYSLGF